MYQSKPYSHSTDSKPCLQMVKLLPKHCSNLPML